MIKKSLYEELTIHIDKCSELITSNALLDYIADVDWDSVRIESPSC